ncbi:MAG: PaaI family thioesterase [Ilumatobacteraceae bacterium]
MTTIYPRAAHYDLLAPDVAARWSKFAKGERIYFPQLLGMTVEEVRVDYCRMRMPHRPEIEQPAGLIHGGAIAGLLDAVMVPAVGASYGPAARFSTVDMHVQYMSAVIGHDVVAEGWITRRGRSVVFCESEAVNVGTGKIAARSILTYNVTGA